MNPNSFALIQLMKKKNGKYLYISNVKFTMKGCPDKIVVFYLILKPDLKVSACQVSSLSEQPFIIFHRKIKKKIFDCFDKDKYLSPNLRNFASSKKGLNIVGSKIGAQ